MKRVIRVNMDLDRNLWAEVSAQAVREGLPKREVVEAALRAYLERRGNDARRDTR